MHRDEPELSFEDVLSVLTDWMGEALTVYVYTQGSDGSQTNFVAEGMLQPVAESGRGEDELRRWVVGPGLRVTIGRRQNRTSFWLGRDNFVSARWDGHKETGSIRDAEGVLPLVTMILDLGALILHVEGPGEGVSSGR